jgi:hypothetical protein
MTSPTLSPQLVEERLGDLHELALLGASLLDAELPPLPRRVLADRSMQVIARAAAGPRHDPRDVRLFVASSVVDRHLGWMADTWLDADNGRICGAGYVVLVEVVVGDSVVDVVPRNHDARVTVRFLEGEPACIGSLPLLARSDRRVRLWLSTHRDHERTRW